MNENNLSLLWEQHWKSKTSIEDTATIYGRWLRRQRLAILESIVKPLPKSYSVLDMGCGSGETTSIFKKLGFSQVIGIDCSKSALVLCKKKNIGCVLSDAKTTGFPDKTFDIVFEEGLWEHLKNYVPYIKEACRVANKYLIAFQPNHFSFAGAVIKLGWDLLFHNRGGIKEYSYPLSHFKQLIEIYGFKFLYLKSTLFGEYCCLVFRRIKD